MKNEKRLFTLLDKFCDNAQLSTKELHEIISLLGNEREDECISKWMQQHWQECSEDFNRINREHVFDRIRRQIEADSNKKLAFMQFFYRCAAILLLPLLGLSAYLFLQTISPSHTEAEIVEILDSQDMPSRVVLSDGSTVTLRSGSRLIKKNSFTGNTREVTLEGEAFFDIAHNPNKPFIIHTGRVRTTALGTSFSITAIPGETSMTVTVAEGKVKVEDGKELFAILEANQQFTYGFEFDVFQMEAIEVDMIADVIEIEALQSPLLIFRNMLFGDIAQDLAVRNGVNIVFQDEELRQRRIDALLDSREPIDVLLRLLCATQQATHTFDGNTYTIKRMR
ncbi:MAG: FecR domain-containing protein [Bacteroidales bacterium]|nr:FecR domain-containing protein [Bacteroidales bacterium]